MSVDIFEEDSWAARMIGNSWPDDTVIYPAEQVGSFGTGRVLMTDDPDTPTMWEVDDFDKVDTPERFDRAFGLWVDGTDIREDVLHEREESAPESEVVTA